MRTDLISSKFLKRGQAWIDIFGNLFFLMPMAIAIMWMSWPIFLLAPKNSEYSSNAGGLIVWPARLMIPVGLFLLVLQGVSERVRLKVLVAAKIGSELPRRLQVLVGAQFICAMGSCTPPLQSPSETGLLHDGYRAVSF